MKTEKTPTKKATNKDAAEAIYEKIVDLCNKVEKKRKSGFILLNEDNEIEHGEIVFSSPFHEKCICFNNGRSWSTIVVHESLSIHGESNLTNEYKAALKHLLKYKMINPKDTISLSNI
jgi:hypothetical protein